MKITRDIDVHLRIGERMMRIQDDIEIDITGEEAVTAVFSGVEGKDVNDYHMKVLLNHFSQFIKAVPDETIAKLSPLSAWPSILRFRWKRFVGGTR